MRYATVIDPLRILLVSGTSGALKKDEIFRVLRPAHLQVSNT
jgi:hypothetical protein